MLKSILPRLIGSVLDNEGIQEFFRELGRDVAKEIPNNVYEKHIKKALDLFEEGLISEVEK